MPPPSDEFDWDALRKGSGGGAPSPQDRRGQQFRDRYAREMGVEDEDEDEGDQESNPTDAQSAEQAGRAAAAYGAYRQRIGRAAMVGGKIVGGEAGELIGDIGEGMAGLDDGQPGVSRKIGARRLGNRAKNLYKNRAIRSLNQQAVRGGMASPEALAARKSAINRIELKGAALQGAVAGALRGENMRDIALSAAGSVLQNRRAKWVMMVIKGGSAITLYGIVVTWATIAIQMYFGNYKKKKWCPKITWWPEGLVWAVISFIVLLILIFLTLAGIVLADVMICVGTFTPTGVLSSLLNGNTENFDCAKKYLELGGAVIRELFNYLDTLL